MTAFSISGENSVKMQPACGIGFWTKISGETHRRVRVDGMHDFLYAYDTGYFNITQTVSWTVLNAEKCSM